MESIKDIRTRITSVQKTMKITNAMYLMASAKLKKAKKALAETAPYFNSMQRAIGKIIAHNDVSNERYFAPTEINGKESCAGIIVVTSDKGLAGAYNHNVCKLADQELINTKNDMIFCVGTTGLRYFQKHHTLNEQIDEEHSFPAGEPSMWMARDLADHVIDLFLDGTLDSVHVVYTRMVNAMTAQTEVMQLLPLKGNMFPSNMVDEKSDYIENFYPSTAAVLHKIVPNYVKGILYGAFVESYACEQFARMSAMDSATKNAKEISSELSLEYNRIRQAQITTEITEVVAGASAQEQ